MQGYKLTALMLLIGSLTFTFGEKAKINKAMIWAKPGDDIELVCSSGQNLNNKPQPLTVCGWTQSRKEHPGEPVFYLNLTDNANTGVQQQGPGKFDFTANKMSQGECNLHIRKVSFNETGMWNCTLIGDDNDVWTGSIQVLLKDFEQPKTPVFMSPTPFDAIMDLIYFPMSLSHERCCVSGGKPINQVKLEFYLDEKLINASSKSVLNDKTCITLDKQFLPEDNGKPLKCISSHPAYDKSDHRSSMTLINVKFPPQVILMEANDSSTKVAALTFDETSVVITFNVRSNPIPLVQLFLNEEDIDSPAEFGFQKYRVAVSKNSDIEHRDEYHCEITISDISKGEYNYIILITNELGVSEIDGSIAVFGNEQQPYRNISDVYFRYRLKRHAELKQKKRCVKFLQIASLCGLLGSLCLIFIAGIKVKRAKNSKSTKKVKGTSAGDKIVEKQPLASSCDINKLHKNPEAKLPIV